MNDGASGRMRLAEHKAYLVEKRSVRKMSTGKPEVTKSLGIPRR
jgi:hypothetical protein